MNTREFLEKDKDRLKNHLSTATGAEEAVRICEDELNRILLQYNEQSPSDTLRRAASSSMMTVRSALPLMSSSGEIRSYERTISASSPKTGFWMPLGFGIALCAAAGFFLTTAPKSLLAVGLILLIAGIVCVFIGGMRFGKRHGYIPEKEQILEVRPDPDKIYYNLSGLLTVVDQQLEDTQYEELREKELPKASAADGISVPEEELQLLSGILETAYARIDSPGADTVISNIRFYLHKKGMEVIEYSDETARYFNKMPSSMNGTLRPAILQGNTVVIKGLAGGGI